MAEMHNFRKAFRGFHCEDVVRYLEYLNHKHNGVVNQLKSENQALEDQLAALRASTAISERDELIAQLQAQLLEKEEQYQALLEQIDASSSAELETYRRAERMERAAKDWSNQIYTQATATLSEAASQVDTAADDFAKAAQIFSSHVQELQSAVDGSKAALENAAATMFAICPNQEEK